MCIICRLHERHLLGPHCELDSREDHQLCQWERALQGNHFPHLRGGEEPCIWRSVQASPLHTPVNRTSLSCHRNEWQWPAIVGSSIWRLLFPRFSSDCLSPGRILGNWEVIPFVFILSGFLLPPSSETFQEKKKKEEKKRERKPLAVKIKRCTCIRCVFFDREIFRLKNIQCSPGTI